MDWDERNHEKAMREALSDAWKDGGTYDAVERARLPVLGAMKRAFEPFYEKRIPKKGKILVLGAGRGFERRLLPESIPDSRIVYLDLDANLLKKIPSLGDAKGRLRTHEEIESDRQEVRKIPGSSYSLPFGDNRFAAVVSLDHFDVFPPEILPRVIAEANRVLKPGGWLIAGQSSLPTIDRWFDIPTELVERYREEGRIEVRAKDAKKIIKLPHERYINAVLGAMREQGMHNVEHKPAIATHYCRRESRHMIDNPHYPGNVNDGEIPTYIHDMGTIVLGSLHRVGFAELRRRLPTSTSRLIEKSPKEVREEFGKDAVAELFSGYVLVGRKPKDKTASRVAETAAAATAERNPTNKPGRKKPGKGKRAKKKKRH